MDRFHLIVVIKEQAHNCIYIYKNISLRLNYGHIEDIIILYVEIVLWLRLSYT